MAQSLIESQSSAIRRRLAEWLREQAQQSLDEFNKYARPDLKLELDDVLRLLNGNFLAPISEHGPLILVGDVGTHQKIIVPGDSLAPLIISGSQTIEIAAEDPDELVSPAANMQPGLETTAACEAHSSPQPPVATPALVAAASAPENSARQPAAGRSQRARRAIRFHLGAWVAAVRVASVV